MEDLKASKGIDTVSKRSSENEIEVVSSFQSRKWKLTGVTAFVAMNISALIITLAIPVSLSAIGGYSDSVTLAVHTFSFKQIQYWIVGLAGIAFLANGVAVVASMIRNRSLRLVALGFLGLSIILTISLAVWGSVDGEGRKNNFKYSWNKMAPETKHLIQSYFSCCGFENISEWQTSSVLPIDESCFAMNSTAATNITWPDGCYDRMTSAYLDAISIHDGLNVLTFEDPKVNPFCVAFVCIFLLLTTIQTTVFYVFALSISTSSNDAYGTDVDDELTIKNPCTIHDEFSSVVNGNAVENAVNGIAVKTDFGKVEAAGMEKTKKYPLSNIADSIACGYDITFYWVGVRVAQNPKMTILLSVILVGCLSTGMIQRYEPLDEFSGVIFLSENSQILAETRLRMSIFYINERDQFVLVVNDSDVISTSNFMTTLEIDKSIKSIATDAGIMFSSICIKIENDCKERSLFESWRFNDTVLSALNSSAILTKVNENPLVSPVFGDNYEISHVLGGVQRNLSGQIISAKAHLLHYVTRSLNQDWEDLFINITQQEYTGVNVYGLASNSQFNESAGNFTNGLPLFFIGFALIFIYIILMTGKFSLLEHRVYIALMGVTSAGLSMAAGIGITSCVGLQWTSLHMIVPFLVLGIGVDDMFVILHSFDAVQDNGNYKHLTLEEKAGKALQNAGASITVTSVTDLVAFAVGATSELGGFASFSVFVAVCIILLFFLQCTFFLACLVIDERRKAERYDAFLVCCYKHDENYKPSKCGQRQICMGVSLCSCRENGKFPCILRTALVAVRRYDKILASEIIFFGILICILKLLQIIFEDGLGRLVSNVPFAVVAICITLGLTGVMGWGFYRLEVSYDPNWYIPAESYMVAYKEKYEEYFSSFGNDASVYVINADFYAEREKLSTLFTSLQNNANLNPIDATSWFESYRTWKNSSSLGFDVFGSSSYVSAAEFYRDVATFLSDASGRKFINDVAFQNGVIIGSKFNIRHRDTTNQVDNVDIISSIREDCEEAHFSDGARAFPFGGLYFIYEITRIIKREIYRNLGITMLCVFVMVMPMLASVQMGFWVALCVAITTVNVAGSIYFAGLSIETSTIITLLLSIGLAVDYAAHVGHKFLTIKGTRQMRARVAVGQIGLAVFNGGFSTFLALVMLSLSDTYSYRVFFTVFVCVVAYGLWSGLVFLPCVLCIVGPQPHANAVEARLSSRHYEKNGSVKSQQTHSIPTDHSTTALDQ